MLHSKTPTTLFSFLTALLVSTHQTSATPYHRDVPESLDSPAILVDRACPVPCGWQSQLCCTANQRCYTDSAGQAQCGALAADAQGISTVSGAWQYYTSTWVETDLLTRSSVYSTYIPGPTAAGVNCNFALLELPCGNICCQAGQVCQVLGQCVASGGGSSGFYSSNYGSFSAPLRPTSGSPTTVTSFATPTATVPFLPPIGSASGIVYPAAAAPHKLSGGAIAGIVIGVLAGIILLLMICFYCCLRSSFDHILAIFGLGPRRRTSETVIEEHHHASGGGGWFGRPSGVGAAERPSRTGGWGGAAAALAALAVMLGLRRRHSSYGSKSSYTYTSSSYDTSE
ncbi:MAG: hypothetical protein M1839_004450, partial [Geoglossum umbratile]